MNATNIGYLVQLAFIAGAALFVVGLHLMNSPATAVECMRAGSIIVDMAASDLGGNCELSRPGEVVVTPNGVAIHAPLNLPASMPTGASAFYSRNMLNLLLNFVSMGELRFDFEDAVTAATVITYGGKVVQEATRKLLQPASRGGAKA